MERRQCWIFMLAIGLVMLMLYTERRLPTQLPSHNTFDFPPQPIVDNSMKTKQTSAFAVEKINAIRRLRVEQECENMGTPQNNKYLVGNMKGREFIEKGHNILFCPIPKVSSTFWKWLLMNVGTNGTYSWPFERDALKGVERVLNRTKDYTTLNYMDNASEFNLTTAFMFVRNPYARLYSGYVDKLYTPTGNRWVQNWGKVGNTIRNSSKYFEYDITFREFVQYILQLHKENETIDIHFKPMNEICDACAIPYSFIGHLETIVDDSTYLINKWTNEFPDININFSDFEQESAIDTARKIIFRLFRAKGSSKLKNFPIYNMSVRIWCNLQIRGYISKLSRFPFSKSEISTLTEERYMDAVINELGNRKDISAIKNQRTEAYIQAYQTIPLTVMRQLREYLLKDCTLFGYDDKPKELFDRKTLIVDHHYLDGL